MLWPPDLDKIRSQGVYSFSFMSQRVSEVVYFFGEVCPLTGKALNDLAEGLTRYDFLDAHYTMSRLAGTAPLQDKDIADPWVLKPYTIVGSSTLVVRISTKTNGRLVTRIRALDGFEVLSMAGWDRTFYKKAGSYRKLPRCTLTSLAGNAFSAFAAGPMAMLGAAALGRGDVPRTSIDNDRAVSVSSADFGLSQLSDI